VETRKVGSIDCMGLFKQAAPAPGMLARAGGWLGGHMDGVIRGVGAAGRAIRPGYRRGVADAVGRGAGAAGQVLQGTGSAVGSALNRFSRAGGLHSAAVLGGLGGAGYLADQVARPRPQQQQIPAYPYGY